MNIDAYSGETLSLSFVCKDAAGAAVNLTGYAARATVRTTPTASTVTLNLSPTIPTPGNGTVLVNVSDETTATVPAGIYYWDLVLDTPTGTVIYVAGGTIKFRTLVTRVS